ncbi:NAD-dependent formate dehydrogenase gamma subunit [Roseibacterium elongatum DSM 19469]|uniref:NAD-dependent formate dehydrogenase gamma subunit n=2 Tax=Roseicyclus elongatus TaxID=159346 RepID=W8S5K3_9RHOB|nr:NAD-dependent formate dehydrogenase gamma subunit [Roseibacterium elongatum DSM 19469]
MQIIDRHRHREGPLLPILHDLQHVFGCIPMQVRPAIAEALNITQSELHGVISFYHDFRDEPAGRHVLKICRSEACQSMGGAALGDRVLSLLGLGWGETSADGRITVEPVYCLGLCACAPAAMVNGKLKGRAEAQALVAEITA